MTMPREKTNHDNGVLDEHHFTVTAIAEKQIPLKTIQATARGTESA